MSVEKRGGRWRARVYVPGAGERSRTFDRRRDAEAWFADQRAAVQSGVWVDPQLGRRSFGDVAGEWFEARRVGLGANAAATTESVMRLHVLPVLGDLRIGSVGRSQVQALVGGMVDRGYSRSMVKKAYQVAAQVLDFAAAEGYGSPRHRVREVVLPADERRPGEVFEILDPVELWQLADAVHPRFRALVLVAGLAGLRWGEVAGLEVSQVDLVGRSLTVDRSLLEVGGRIVGSKRPKGGRGRVVSMPRVLADELGAHLGSFVSVDHPLQVFTGLHGGRLYRSTFRRHWVPARAAIGRPGLRFHDLRHSHAAALIAAGVHAKVIQERLGHAEISTTFDVYGHLFPGLDVEVAELLDRQAVEAARWRADSRGVVGGA